MVTCGRFEISTLISPSLDKSATFNKTKKRNFPYIIGLLFLSHMRVDYQGIWARKERFLKGRCLQQDWKILAFLGHLSANLLIHLSLSPPASQLCNFPFCKVFLSLFPCLPACRTRDFPKTGSSVFLQLSEKCLGVWGFRAFERAARDPSFLTRQTRIIRKKSFFLPLTYLHFAVEIVISSFRSR